MQSHTHSDARVHLHPCIDPSKPPPDSHTNIHTNTLNERNQEGTTHAHLRTCAWAQAHTHKHMQHHNIPAKVIVIAATIMHSMPWPTTRKGMARAGREDATGKMTEGCHMGYAGG